MRNTKYQLLQLIIEGKIDVRRGLGRKNMSWLRNIGKTLDGDTEGARPDTCAKE